jgi:hypothetical protein
MTSAAHGIKRLALSQNDAAVRDQLGSSHLAGQEYEDRIIELVAENDPLAPRSGGDRAGFCLDEVNKALTAARVAAARAREALPK